MIALMRGLGVQPNFMSLVQDVTFDSLGAIRQEIREWLGPDAVVPTRNDKNRVARDVLVSVLIHNLAEELSDVRTRSADSGSLGAFYPDGGENG
jgi:hypothetical protein